MRSNWEGASSSSARRVCTAEVRRTLDTTSRFTRMRDGCCATTPKWWISRMCRRERVTSCSMRRNGLFVRDSTNRGVSWSKTPTLRSRFLHVYSVELPFCEESQHGIVRVGCCDARSHRTSILSCIRRDTEFVWTILRRSAF